MQPLLRYTLASAVATAAIHHAFAQDAAATGERLRRPILEERITPATTLSEVVVTAETESTYRAEAATSATRLAAPILDTPRSVSVVTRQLIQDRQIVDPQEAVQNVAGVQRAGGRTGAEANYLIRGFQQQAQIKDGFRAGDFASSGIFTFEGPTDVANLERIEFLKGPSAILYGRGEPGGVVNYITNAPGFENRFALQQIVGSYDFYRTQLNANWNAIPDRLAVRLDGAYERNQSFIDYVEGERAFLAPSLKWQIAESTSLTFRGEYSQDERSTSTGLPYVEGRVLPGVPYHRYFGEPDETVIQAESWRGLLQLDHKWNENHRTVASVHGVYTEADGLNLLLFNFAGPLIDPVTGDVSRIAEGFDATGEYFTARLDHTWDWTIYEAPSRTVTDKDGKTTTVAGGGFPTVKNQLLLSGEFERQRNNRTRVLSGQAPLNPYRPHYTGYAPQPLVPGFPVTFGDLADDVGEATSILLMDRLSFGETVYLSFGGRYEWFSAESDFAFTGTTAFGPPTYNELDEETFNPFVGLVVKPARNVSLYGSYAESTSSFQNVGLRTVNGSSLDPERSRQYETGVKVEFFGGKLLTTLSLFHIEKTDVAGADPANPLFSVNAGEDRSRGVEFEVSGEPLPGWRITANYAYVDARSVDDPLKLTVDNRLLGVPENSGGLFTTYEIQDGPLKGFGLGGGVFFADRVEIDRANSGNISGWAQGELVAFYRRKHFQAQVNVKNLLDSEYYYAGSGEGGGEVQRGAARTILGSVKFEF